MSSLAIALAIAVVPGCGMAHDQPDVQQESTSLWAARTPYVGDNSRVNALVERIAPPAHHRISLQTTKAPYAMTVEMGPMDKPFATIDFSSNAMLLLGLVGNLGAVTFTSGTHSWALTAEEASQRLGWDVKAMGRDQKRLTSYLQQRSD